ncbi:hypothetical protein [Reinekea sp. G2M2-21]|uniref:hypothetical protein n=1 Tax=Reinekea sp. G2M2-21 TaxID=2788942 RepID=UPI0018A8EEDD|nr:hypothetical protein [Reinekea sp. G2M2-21]
MKKSVLFAVSLLSSSIALAGSIGENFEPGGYALTGFANYSSDSDSGWKSFYLSSGVTFYPKQNVSLNAGFSFQNYGFDDAMEQSVYLRAGAAYAFGYNPMAKTGLVHTVGFYGYRYTYTDVNDVTSDANIFVTPYYRADYFLTERISVYSTLELFMLDLSTGSDELVDTGLDITGGIAVHFPNSFSDWSKIFKK